MAARDACPTRAIALVPRGEVPDEQLRPIEHRGDAQAVDALAIDHVNLFVSDLERSTAFYSALLGVTLKEEGVNKSVRWRILGRTKRFYVALYENRGAKFKPDDLHINHVGFYVEDFEASVARIHALGLTLEYGDRPVDWPRSRSAYVKDPDGITIEFTERFGGGLD